MPRGRTRRGWMASRGEIRSGGREGDGPTARGVRDVEEGGWWVLSLITSQDGQERETPERMLLRCRSVAWRGGGRFVLGRGEYIRNVLPPTLVFYLLRRHCAFPLTSLSLSLFLSHSLPPLSLFLCLSASYPLFEHRGLWSSSAISLPRVWSLSFVWSISLVFIVRTYFSSSSRLVAFRMARL